MAIERYRKKRDQPEPDQYAARYTPLAPDLVDLQTVARMCDQNAELVEAEFSFGPVLIVRYTAHHDDHPSTIEYQAVEAEHYLAYSGDYDHLYDTTGADWRRWYDRVEEG